MVDQEVLDSQLRTDPFPFPSEGDITLRVRNADMSLVKPLPRTEHFEKRGHAVPPSLSETTHAPWH